MMGGGGASAAGAHATSSGAAATAEDKRKLLWGAKKQAAAATAAPVPAAPGAAFGSNRWDAAEFGSEEQKQKFLRLMGGKSAAVPASAEQAPVYGLLPEAGAAAAPPPAQQEQPRAAGIMRREEQQRVLSELEREFTTGVSRRMAGGRTGLGL